MLVRKLLVAYIMNIGSLNRLRSIIFWRMAALPESVWQQRTLEVVSVSGIPARVDSLQSSIERRYLSGFLLDKHHHCWGSSSLGFIVIILPVLRQVEKGAAVENIFPAHHLQVHLGPVAFLLSFELSHASKLNMRSVSVVQHGGVRHRHPGSVSLVLLSHSHLLAEGLQRGHVATVEQQLLQELTLLELNL